MAYCPKCNKVVEEKWIECPVCRTEVLHKDFPQRQDKTVLLNKPSGAGRGVKQYDFLSRIKGVLTFDSGVFSSFAIKPPIGEAILLYVIATVAGYVLATPLLFTSFAQMPGIPGMPTGPAFWTAAIIIGFVFNIIATLLFIACIHLALKILQGQANFLTTSTTMLFVMTVWGIVFNVIYTPLYMLMGFTMDMTSPMAMLCSPAYLFMLLVSLISIAVIAAGYVVGLSTVHDLSKLKTFGGMVLGSILCLAIVLILEFALMAVFMAALGFPF